MSVIRDQSQWIGSWGTNGPPSPKPGQQQLLISNETNAQGVLAVTVSRQAWLYGRWETVKEVTVTGSGAIPDRAVLGMLVDWRGEF